MSMVASKMEARAATVITLIGYREGLGLDIDGAPRWGKPLCLCCLTASNCAARRGGHDFYSMTFKPAGKCRSPCGGSRVGTSEWLGGETPARFPLVAEEECLAASGGLKCGC